VNVFTKGKKIKFLGEKIMDNRPIGIFDSGLGGLTVLRAVKDIMPNESTVYVGDSGRAPYGTKSKETVIKYTNQDINFLLEQDVKMIVIACNTASACSLDIVKNNFNVPIVEVVQPGSAAAVRLTKNKKIGVIGTNATIGSGVYEKAIKALMPEAEIYSKACPLFVSLAEEGWWDNDITYRIVEEYLTPLKEKGIDTLILGCTHYPLLQKSISRFMGESVQLVNSALEAARAVKKIIEEKNIGRVSLEKPVHKYYTSDSVEKFRELGSSFLQEELEHAERADIEKY